MCAKCWQMAAQAKDAGSQRFCMGAAWRNPKDRDMPAIVEIVEGVSAMGLETCMTLGMLTADAGAASSPRRGSTITTTTSTAAPNITSGSSPPAHSPTGSTRWKTCAARGSTSARAGSSAWARRRGDRVGFIHTLATLPQHPESVPVNALVPVKGTVLGDMLADTPLAKIDDIEFVRTIAVARITMPLSMVRLSAGRESMSEATQALCFLAGANSIFTGDKLLTGAQCGRR